MYGTESSQATLQSQAELHHPPSKIHSLFPNPYVLRQIIRYLELPSDDSTAQSHLLSVALACKAFKDPTLDVLWRCLDTFTPLLRLLSPFKKINGCYVRDHHMLPITMANEALGVSRSI
jgi:hypothetical protein